MANHTIRTSQKRAAFLNALAATASVSKAIEIVKIARDTIYAWRRDDPEFAREWDAALEIGCDILEDEAVRRGRDGVEKPVYQGGKLSPNKLWIFRCALPFQRTTMIPLFLRPSRSKSPILPNSFPSMI